MKHQRSISEPEKALIKALMQNQSSTAFLLKTLNNLQVVEMNDGGMGSLLLVPKGVENASRTFGKQIGLGEFTDRDGTPVSVALNVDSEGNLFELDVWKVDFSPLLTWPDPTDIRIVG